jgi:hypothetical protein
MAPPRRACLLPIAPVPLPPVRNHYPVGPGRCGLSLHRTGMMAMLQSCGASFHVRCVYSHFWSRARPENALLSGLFVARPRSYWPSVLRAYPPPRSGTTLRTLLPGGPIPSRPGLSGFSLHQAGVMVMLRGLRGRNPDTRMPVLSFPRWPSPSPERDYPPAPAFFVLSAGSRCSINY